jgi:hypothetical protein
VAIRTDIEPVPMLGLAAHFSPLPRMAPPFVSWIAGAQVPSSWLPLYLRRRAMGWQGVHRQRPPCPASMTAADCFVMKFLHLGEH